jgi:hypothetical protein
MFALPKIGLKVNILWLAENAFAEQGKGIFENSICNVKNERAQGGGRNS